MKKTLSHLHALNQHPIKNIDNALNKLFEAKKEASMSVIKIIDNNGLLMNPYSYYVFMGALRECLKDRGYENDFVVEYELKGFEIKGGINEES